MDSGSYKHILIATDGSELAGHAMRQGLALAKALGAKVTIVTVTEPPAAVGANFFALAGTTFDPLTAVVEAQAEAAAATIKAAVTAAAAQGIEAETVVVEDSYPAEGIIHTAEEKGADLIVMASHGRRGIGRLLLGSQTTQVLTHTAIPVLVTR